MEASRRGTGENAENPTGNILYICCPSTHILVVHVGKHLGKPLCGFIDRILGIGLFLADNSCDGFAIVQILQHHLMDLKKKGILFSHFLSGFGIQHGKLRHRLASGRFKAFDLRLRIGYGVLFHLKSISEKIPDFSKGDAGAGAFTVDNRHSFSSSHRFSFRKASMAAAAASS